MAAIGDWVRLRMVKELPMGWYLDAGAELGEVLLPRREAGGTTDGESFEVFLYLDSEGRPVATTRKPKAMPGDFVLLECVAVNDTGAFLDWGLAKDLLVPFREQRKAMQPGKSYVVRVLVDQKSGRLIASTRIDRFLSQARQLMSGDEVDLMIYDKSPLGYKAVVNRRHSGLLHLANAIQPLKPGEQLKGFVSQVRPDGKLDLVLHAGGRARVEEFETALFRELLARGGFLPFHDDSPAEQIRAEFGVSKRTFKQAVGALLKQGRIMVEPGGLRRTQGNA